MRYLSAEEILVLHSEIIDATGGLHGVRDIGLLAAIAEKPRAAFGGADLYPDLFTKAAIYLESVVNYHVFLDGNKRTGLIVCARSLFSNGHDLVASNLAVEKFVLSIAMKKLEVGQIADWLKKHSKRHRSERKKESHD